MNSRRGFALMIVLVLLALSLVVTFSLLSLSKVNVATARTGEYQLQARQNALAGLKLAVHRLQTLAGPDQRATAEGDIVAGRNDAKAHWTGVWNNSGALRGWLVSGNATSVLTDLAAGTNSKLVKLVGTTSVGSNLTQHVSVETEPVFGTAALANPELPQGNFAYWVGDEGVKATANFDETLDRADAGRRQRQEIAARPRIEEIASSLDPTTPSVRSKLGKIQTYQQIKFAAAGSFSAADYFYDLTSQSLGVLSNPISGGLKIDLSAADGAQQVGGAALSSWLSIRPQAIAANNQATYTITGPSSGATVAPIITEFVVKFAFYRKGASTATTGTLDFYLHCQVQIELWNPYSSALVAGAPLRIRVSGLPTSLMFTSGAGADYGPIDLQAAVDGMDFSLPAGTSFASGATATFYGGGASGWSNSSNSQDGSFASLGFAVPSATTALRNYTLRASDPSVSNTIAVSLNLGNDALGSVAPSTPFSTPIVPSTTWGSDTASGRNTWVLGYGFAVRDSLDQLTNGASASATDPRATSGNALPVETAASQWKFDPYQNRSRAIALTSSATNGVTFYGSTAQSAPKYMIWELPRKEVISIGTLQHFPATVRPNATGNPWGGDANRIFDTAFFSALPRSGAWNPPPLPLGPNAFLSLYEGRAPPTRAQLLGAQTATEHLLVRGAFNVNSTSARAWKTLLSGAKLPERYFLSTVTTETGHAFFRHAHSAQEYSQQKGATNLDKPSSSEGWRQGGRNLSDSHVDALAPAVAALVRAHGRPFVSVSDFLSAGVLHNALDPSASVAGITANQEATRLSINSGLTNGQPGYLSQADVITMIAPIIQTRSDTFRVRVYGDAVDSADGSVKASAYCEAIVQRTPEYLDAPRGRKIVITYFRWLSPDDI